MSFPIRVFELRRATVRWLIERIAPTGFARSPRRTRIYQWMRRYGMAEATGIVCALFGSALVHHVTGSAVAAAYAAAWCESIGYATIVVTQDFLSESRVARAAEEKMSARRVGGVMSGLAAEFGPAALLDTFLTRPLAMGIAVKLLGLKLGVVTGKLVADALFYVPVIFVYERRAQGARDSIPPH